MSIQEIEAEALRLPPEQRARLAQHLIASLDEADDTERAWTEEASRRAEQIASGDVESLPAADVFTEARRAIT